MATANDTPEDYRHELLIHALLVHALRVLAFLARRLRRLADFLDGPVTVAILRYIVRRARRRQGIGEPAA